MTQQRRRVTLHATYVGLWSLGEGREHEDGRDWSSATGKMYIKMYTKMYMKMYINRRGKLKFIRCSSIFGLEERFLLNGFAAK